MNKTSSYKSQPKAYPPGNLTALFLSNIYSMFYAIPYILSFYKADDVNSVF